MTIHITFTNGHTTNTNVAPHFTQEMLNECFVGKTMFGLEIESAIVSPVQFY